MTKICSRCNQSKKVSMFNKHKHRKDGLQSFCRNCQKTRFNAYYRENHSWMKDDTVQRKRESVMRGQVYVAEHLKTHPCVDCANKDIRVLEFDHLGEEDKIDGVMQLVRNGSSIDRIAKEITKCEVRCRNCHTIKTYERQGGSWHDEFCLMG